MTAIVDLPSLSVIRREPIPSASEPRLGTADCLASLRPPPSGDFVPGRTAGANRDRFSHRLAPEGGRAFAADRDGCSSMIIPYPFSPVKQFRYSNSKYGHRAGTIRLFCPLNGTLLALPANLGARKPREGLTFDSYLESLRPKNERGLTALAQVSGVEVSGRADGVHRPGHRGMQSHGHQRIERTSHQDAQEHVVDVDVPPPVEAAEASVKGRVIGQ
jgi:hypothetical protein